MAISADERGERERTVSEAIHSNQMEGLDVTEAWRDDATEYVAGRIDDEELVSRSRERYGIHTTLKMIEENVF